MGFADNYIRKNQGKYFFGPTKMLPFKMVVVIPCYDEPEIRHTILSLLACEYPGVEVGILVVVNSTPSSPEKVKRQNKETLFELSLLSSDVKSGFNLFVIDAENLPDKHGGVGWTRKIGMDWAIVQLDHFDEKEGIIVSLDADTLVEKNYLLSIYEFFKVHPAKVAATINFEHTFNSCDFKTEDHIVASVYYELYMRYYRNALLFTGFPNSIYTVGSCFAVKARAYVAQGGMNRRKAGEDFYFLHKMVLLGEIGEISTTTVYPSSRLSNRVPFGTGPAIQKYCEGNRNIENTYPLEAFEILKSFFADIETYYHDGDNFKAEDLSKNASFIRFSIETKLPEEIRELSANCSSVEVFKKRFFHLFNAFRVLKWLNYALQNGFQNKNILIESQKLLILMGVDENCIKADPLFMLTLFRSIDKNRANHSIF